MWHASTAGHRPQVTRERLERTARGVLEDVGDPAAGEWAQWTGRAFHLRRRLSAQEAELVGPVIDVRGTPEAARRMAAIDHLLPPGFLSPEQRARGV